MNRDPKHSQLFVLFLLLLFCGCGGHRAHIAPLGPDSVIVAFGDSLTAGSGVGRDETYPVILGTILGCKVVNAGVGGEVSEEGRQRLPSVLEQHHPELVILCHGGNDLLQRRSPEALADNLSEMLRMIRAAGAEGVLIGVPRPGLPLKTVPLYRQLARQFKVPLENDVLADILSTPRLKGDQIHPNARGNRKLAEAVADLIRRSRG